MVRREDSLMASATFGSTAESLISSWARFPSTQRRCALRLTSWWQITEGKRSSRCLDPCRRLPSSKRPHETLEIPGGVRMIQEYYRQMRKFGCNILAVVQQYDVLKTSEVRGAMIGNSKKFLKLKSEGLDFAVTTKG